MRTEQERRAMGAIPNIRQERFARLVVKGLPPFRAYPEAGYKFNEANPYRLKGNERVKSRISELQRAAQMRTINTVESIADELDEARKLAASIEQPSAMVAATTAKAKLLGLMIDRAEAKALGVSLEALMIWLETKATPAPTHDAPDSSN
jgi:hypothetical protein